jgi:energy-coupling factor transporter ATP-binding protein EcfA2
MTEGHSVAAAAAHDEGSGVNESAPSTMPPAPTMPPSVTTATSVTPSSAVAGSAATGPSGSLAVAPGSVVPEQLSGPPATTSLFSVPAGAVSATETGPAPAPNSLPPPGSEVAAGTASARTAQGKPSAGQPAAGQALVDGRLIESAILALRKPIVAAELPLDTPGSEDARAERRKLLGQLDDYLLPRLRESGSPILVALVGSTGAGKSTLVNSLVGAEVSMTGIRRPTTNSPVLACHPDDVGWFAENVFLPTVPRVRQEGLARSGRDGLLVLAANEGMPKGVALLDTPDIDSVVQAHRAFAHQFLDASDLWLFMTTAGRYADASVWELLQQARDRGAAMGIVLARIPGGADEVIDHFSAMLEANGLGDRDRFLIPETVLTDGRLPTEVARPIRQWLEEAASRTERRIAVLTQTMSGVIDTFRTRVPALASQVETQIAVRADLTRAADVAYRSALAEVGESLWNGSLLRGEVLASWQELAGTGDLLRALQPRRAGKLRHQRSADRVLALKQAVRSSVESMILSVADRAAEDTVRRWLGDQAGRSLLEEKPPAAEETSEWAAQLAADMNLLFGSSNGNESHAGPGTTRADAGDGDRGAIWGQHALARSSPDLTRHASQAVSAWQDLIVRLVTEDHVTKRSVARTVNLDDDSLATVITLALLGAAAPEPDGGTGAVPQRLLTTLFGAGPLRRITVRAQADLLERIRLIFDEEMRRFAGLLEGAGVPDAAVAVQLYQATYALEMVR